VTRTSYELTRCPVCDGTATREIASPDAIRAEVERLWAFHGRRLRAEIPPARLVDRVAFSQRPPLRLVACDACTHLYRNPRERRDALADAYTETGSTPAESVLQSLFETQRAAYRAQARRLVAVAGPHGRGIEVGSYVGGFLAAAREVGWQFRGVDVSLAASAFAARQGLDVVTGTLEALPGDGAHDVVAVWNTFEQLYDARTAVLAARRLLRDGGTFVVRIPNGAFYERWQRRLAGRAAGVAERLLAHNNLLGFPYRQGFTARSLGRLVGECGFRIVRVFGDTLVPVADEWTTPIGAMDERVTKQVQRAVQRGWHAPWVEVYARAS